MRHNKNKFKANMIKVAEILFKNVFINNSNIAYKAKLVNIDIFLFDSATPAERAPYFSHSLYYRGHGV